MKKIFKVLVLLFVFCFCIPVFAETHTTMELIPATETATIDTTMFTYTDIAYTPTVPNRSFGRFTFKSITNKTDKSIPVSIDILLFDTEGKNIGYVTYCTDNDVGGDYSKKHLAAGQSMTFSINVGDKYFPEGNTPVDVSYYAVQDDNEYCHVGGYDKYIGLTIDDIKQGRIMLDDGSGGKFMYDQQLIELFESVSWGLVMVLLIGSLVVCIVKGLFLNALYKRMFDMTSPFSYLPICSEYIAIKLAFGTMVAKIYIIACFLIGPLSLVLPAIALVSVILGLLNGVAWIIDLVKLITKNYGMCYLEPYNPIGEDGEVKLRLPSEKTKIPVVEEKDDEEVEEEENITSIDATSEEGGQVLNLNYDDVGNMEDDTSTVDVDNLNKNILDDDETVNNKEGESDLMNLFK